MSGTEERLLEMGFSREQSKSAVEAGGDDFDSALNWLIAKQSEEPRLYCTVCNETFSTEDEAFKHSFRTTHESFDEISSQQATSKSPEKVQQRAADLRKRLQEKREKQLLLEQEEEKRRELLKRQSARDSQKLAKETEEQQYARELERQRRERERDLEAKRKVLEAIARDRQERQSVPQPATVAATATTAPISVQSKVANGDFVKVHFRTRSGKSAIEEFSVKDRVEVAIDALKRRSAELQLGSSFSLYLPMPRRRIADTTQTFADLKLFGNIALIVD